MPEDTNFNSNASEPPEMKDIELNRTLLTPSSYNVIKSNLEKILHYKPEFKKLIRLQLNCNAIWFMDSMIALVCSNSELEGDGTQATLDYWCDKIENITGVKII